MSVIDHSPSAGTGAADPSPPRSWVPLLKRLHFYAGILIAPFLLVAAVTGGLYAVAPTVEKFVYADLLTTDSSGSPAPLADQVRAAQLRFPDLMVSAVRPPASAGDTTRVLFADPSLGESETRAVFIDPVSTDVVGDSVSYGSAAALPLRTWLSGLHRNLHLGEPGRLYSELAASWLWVVALGGLMLWVARYRNKRRNNPAKARLATVDRSARGRTRNLNWHGVLGIWIALGLLMLSATGLTWSRYAGENVGDLRSALSWTTPSVNTDLGAEPDAPSSGGGHDHGHGASSSGADTTVVTRNVGRLDAVLAAAREAGIDDAVQVGIPSTPHTAFTVTEVRREWQLSPSSVAVEGDSGDIVDISWFGDWPLAAKLTTWGIALHMGLLFGLASQLALAALAVVLVIVIVRGYAMWWQRRPRNESRPTGTPPVRGPWRRVPPAAGVAGLVAVVAVGWFLPLLGIPLLVFLSADGAVGAWTRHRATMT
ncbi:PepSY domain-containing protein [Gordonia pseudamarae]|jgi:uncharacterized iron-regulated membrane protein|uniref:PepSY domain-containing protein n=1 Tax=Gordonia pseudamarae TaxID=2831662 RepID=A0ABX6IFI4_9ACTN|nr:MULTISPECIES: PepSY domain-containing protein [Gordonia]MBD0020478.1 PepSY domain-containing protein [Gordonia sp. (in: high G+C Gram-positive bacteria)]QHN25674.1 PepSY domain-containing protein [Gordonia pseudamarae]QHN34606.1 PepSY domain-containing protein [Gordonia pseudamarae]